MTSANRYPDSHPDIRKDLVTVTTPAGTTEYMPREAWETVVAQRDEYRRTLALISAWRLDSGVRDRTLDVLLEQAGEDYDSARAMRDLIAEVRAATTHTTGGGAS